MIFKYHVAAGDLTNVASTSGKVEKLFKQIGVNADIVKHTVIALYDVEVNRIAYLYRGDGVKITHYINQENYV